MPSDFRGGLRPPPTALPASAGGVPIDRRSGPRPGRGGERIGPASPQAASITVHVQPRAARNEIVARSGSALRVRVTAPPAGGAANDAVCALLAASLGCPPSTVTVVRGHSARTKVVRIAGLSPADVRARLGPEA